MTTTTFNSLATGQTFDFIDDANPSHNSFFKRCVKLTERRYMSLDDKQIHVVGSIKAKVYHVARSIPDQFV